MFHIYVVILTFSSINWKSTLTGKFHKKTVVDLDDRVNLYVYVWLRQNCLAYISRLTWKCILLFIVYMVGLCCTEDCLLEQCTRSFFVSISTVLQDRPNQLSIMPSHTGSSLSRYDNTSPCLQTV